MWGQILLNIITSNILSGQAPGNETKISFELTGMGYCFVGLIMGGILLLAIIGLIKGLNQPKVDDNTNKSDANKSKADNKSIKGNEDEVIAGFKPNFNTDLDDKA